MHNTTLLRKLKWGQNAWCCIINSLTAILFISIVFIIGDDISCGYERDFA